MPQVTAVIQLLVAPVIMISACGLLCLALYNRLAAIVTRMRTFHLERVQLLQRQGTMDDAARQSGAGGLLAQRIQTLDRQVAGILRRARLVRGALVGLMITVLCMLLCSLSVGLSMAIQRPIVEFVAVGVFVLGVIAAVIAIVLAIIELGRALEPVMLEMHETEMLEATLPRDAG